MFLFEQRVVCIDEKMGGMGPVLEEGETYTVEGYTSPEESKEVWPDKPWWPQNGGRVVLKEFPKCEWFARRFQPA